MNLSLCWFVQVIKFFPFEIILALHVTYSSGTSQLFYPPTKTGIISLSANEQIELYCSGGFSTPSGAGTTVLATCSTSNQFVYNNVRYDFKNFYCSGFTASAARKTSTRCYNNGYIIEHGFPVGTRFVKIYEACHNDVSEETYYVKHAFTPANAGYQSGKLITSSASYHNSNFGCSW